MTAVKTHLYKENLKLKMFPTRLRILFLLVLQGQAYATRQTFEKILRNKLFVQNEYDKTVRPVKDYNKPINVSFSLRVSKLLELNTKKQLLIIDAWIVQIWYNPFLSWNESEHGGIHTLHVTPDNMWVPDTVLYNNGDQEVSQAGYLKKFKTYIMLDSSGKCTWMTPTSFKSSCSMDITNFPFDSQTCEMTFGSWAYDERLVKMHLLHQTHRAAKKFVSNGDWHLRKVSVKQRLEWYLCCPHPFSDITYTFILDRKPSYHVMYYIVPCVIISFLSLASFFLPPDCGERIGLTVTVLLAMSVYLLIVSDILPETSDYVPRLGLYYMSVMGEVALVLGATIISIRCHFARGKPPQFVMRLTGHNGIVKTKKIVVLPLNDVAINTDAIENGENLKEEEKERQATKTEKTKVAINKREMWRECWMELASRIDMAFFIMFTLIFIISSLVILLSRK